MIKDNLFNLDRVSDNLLSALETRDAALWIRSMPQNTAEIVDLSRLIGLPWKLVISDIYDEHLFNPLETEGDSDDLLTRKRGFAQVIDSDPSRISLPPRSLPIYLLNGRHQTPLSTDFSSLVRQVNMLEELRRSGARHLLVIAANDDPVPQPLKELWSGGFRAHVTFITDISKAIAVAEWAKTSATGAPVSLIVDDVGHVVADVLFRYWATFPEDRQILRVRDVHGLIHKVDVTSIDDPERPLMDWYSLIEERHLVSASPEDLVEDELTAFFRGGSLSWRPYAAGLPWIRDPEWAKTLSSQLKRLDNSGADENRIVYIVSESGAGGTTLSRALAWNFSREGYVTLLAKPIPFVPDALPVVNYLNRIYSSIGNQVSRESRRKEESVDSIARSYQAPCLIVFDTLHWQNREDQLLRFANEIQKSGRPVCVLAVTDSLLSESLLETKASKVIAELNHVIGLDDALSLGEHLNKFLRRFGKQKDNRQWQRFYEDHTIRSSEGLAAFWVTLSFWIQGQYDLSESIQDWMYRCFKENAIDLRLKAAVLRIAAMSSERLPLPELLLPPSRGDWPISQLLGEARPRLAALGLVQLTTGGEKHWALIHDILGRFLINAVYYDFQARTELGFSGARDPEHLRYLLLRDLSREPVLGERAFRHLGEEFATSIFKIDPDHGKSGFTNIWRDILQALDSMPNALRDTSRVFRHHTAVSRRRIAKLDERFYGVTIVDKIQLLLSAIKDINYALFQLDYTPGSESNLNLWNSLANAYFDLAEVSESAGAPQEKVLDARRKANDATRRAYEESPTNSFVIETYVKNLLQSAQSSAPQAIDDCVHALGILFSALSSSGSIYRHMQLSSLADRALSILLKKVPATNGYSEPTSAVDVLVNAWKVLAANADGQASALDSIPDQARKEALTLLESPAGRGNMQVIRLRYDLICTDKPSAFDQQLELVEQIQASNTRVTPQLKLEYAILLYQNGRPLEGEKVFRSLRELWRSSDYFVEVPERLRWLRGPDRKGLKTVHATIGPDAAIRTMAIVQEFGNSHAPFRPQEHGMRDLRVGMRFSCHVSFGHNGPFLRPVTAGMRG